MISIELQQQVAILRLDRNTTNAINLGLVEALSTALQDVKQDPEVRALVLTSANDKFFSIGFDIPELYELARQEFETFYREFNRLCIDLYMLPKPVVAGLNGHTIAGGCILALCCDYRLMTAGKRLIGLNEINLGVPVPYLADCILRELLGIRVARQILETGDFYSPERAMQVGLVDQVLPPELMLPNAIQKASSLGNSPGKAYALIKQNRVESIEAQTLALWHKKQAAFVDCWYSQEARQLLNQAMDKF
jgi:enoyl-CoA hydratase/carnithine racemase